MADQDKKSWVAIIPALDTKTKVIGLIALVAEASFLGSLAKLPADQTLYALITCAVLFAISVVGMLSVEIVEKWSARTSSKPVIPSPGTPDSTLLTEVINGAIQTVCRAVSLPKSPQDAKLRVFIFQKEGNQLVCSHYWSQNPVKELVGKLRFDINSEVAKKVAVVRAVIDESICRTEVEPLPKNFKGVAGDVSDDLSFVVAAPITKKDGSIWGTVDFDTATESGKLILSTEESNALMFQLAQHIRVIFSLEGDT